MRKHYHVTNGLTLFLNSPPTNYEPLSDYLTAYVGAVPQSQKAGDAVLLLGSKRVLVPQGGEWVRKPNGMTARLFVNCKTRQTPFFVYPEPVSWDGALLGLTPTQKAKERFAGLKEMCDWLNSIDWEELGCLHDGRYNFSQRILTNLVVPK